MAKTLKVITQSDTGKNLTFKDTKTGSYMNLPSLMSNIQNGGKYSNDYYIGSNNGTKYVASKPDGKSNNNLG